jgi:ergothioneine biosynthesis protein EgtB
MAAKRELEVAAFAQGSSPVDEYLKIRQTTAELCSTLGVEDCMVQSMTEASPVKWHLAHTTWFFETFLLTPGLSDYKPLDPRYRSLFNSYYNAVGSRPERNTRGAFSRPTLEQVFAYREHVDAQMTRLARHLPKEMRWGFLLGLNHEQQHQELIVTDVIHALSLNPLKPGYRGERRPEHPHPSIEAQRMNWVEFDPGLREIGHSSSGFCFDNERPAHQHYLEAFALADRLVTNAEYLQFMGDRGYHRPELWLSDGWETVRQQNWTAPLYWEQRDSEYWAYTAFGMQPLELHEPVCHLSFYEADAFARWAGGRLPTEFEWEAAAAECEVQGNLLEGGHFHAIAAAEANGKLRQIFGDVWEWTASPYVGYPGYRPAEGALGEYNGKFMSNQMVLRGGSCATPRSHIRATYRNFFPPQARWQFSGIRLAKDVA